jgi:hypothetical protein
MIQAISANKLTCCYTDPPTDWFGGRLWLSKRPG